MPKEAVFALKLEAELREQFMAAAKALHRPASQVMRDLMRDYIARQKTEREHDAWFRAEVEQGLLEADDPNVKLIPHKEVSRKLQAWRDQLDRRSKPAAE